MLGMTFRRMVTFGLAAAAVLALALGLVYVVVACQSLPALLGGVHSDTRPRTKLGAAVLVGGVLLGVAATVTGRRERP
ncbi:MAG: hypothetical protein NVS3B26_29480 [Mycobacteriales bacterium]